MSDDLTAYNEDLTDRVNSLVNLANEAKKGSRDPKEHVEIDQARDIAERCEKLLKEELGEIEGLQDEIRYYEEETDLDREEIAFKISDEFVEGDLGEGLSREERVEAAVRTAIALLTEGVVAAPIEGIGECTIEENDDGTEFIRIYYNGPIRSAGGTGQALSVLVADHVRQQIGIDKFKPRDDEVQRYKEEIKLYDDEKGLQYMPKDKEIITIIDNCPVMLDGMQTGDKEVSGYRDLERIDGNSSRGGVCLVAAEGLAQKAPKMKRIVTANDIDDWEWLNSLSTVTTTEEDDEEEEEETETEVEEINYDDPTNTLLNPSSIERPIFEPSTKYKADITSGRPIFSEPSTKGGFRLRYGRSRNTGIAASGFHPATMIAVNNFMVTGTQQKTERPGKAQGTSPVTGIQGPTVKLDDGTVKRLNTEEEAQQVKDQISEVIDLGEMLINYGEFLENNHPLAPSPYTPEWWVQDLAHAGMPIENLDPDKVDFQTALNLSDKWDIPVHPKHTYLWSDITTEQYQKLSEQMESAIETTDENNYQYKIPNCTDDVVRTVEDLLVNHKQNETDVYLTTEDYERLTYYTDTTVETTNCDTGLDCVNNAIDQQIFPRATVRIGSRLGRPEKADIRDMDGTQALFPIGDKGGRSTDVLEAESSNEGGHRDINTNKPDQDYKGEGTVNVELNNRMCFDCTNTTWKVICPECNERTQKIAQCYNCGNIKAEQKEGEKCQSCYNGKFKLSGYKTLNVKEEVKNALEQIGERKDRIGSSKGVEGLSSISKTPEALEKGLLRGKYDTYIFRDSTVRYDMIDLPLTSFKVEEVIGLTLDKAKELGYQKTVEGKPLEDETQLTEIYPQDIIVSKECGEYLVKAANYIDQLLTTYYDMEPHFNAESKEDLIGSILMGLAPHTSASVACRLIGFTDSKAQYGHPTFHAAKRRNCFHPETTLNYKINGNWKQTTIEELVESHLKPESEGFDDSYDDGSIVQHIENHPEIEELKVPSMTEDGFRTVENVSALSKHQPTKQMVTLHFDDNTEITVTPDHKIPIQKNPGRFEPEEKKAIEIREGDNLFNYGNDKIEEVQQYTEIDVLRNLLENTPEHITLENTMIRGLEKDQVYELLINHIEPQWDDGRFYKMKSSCEYLGITKKTLDNYLRRQSIPVSLFQNLYDDDTEKIIESIPENVRLGVNRDNTEIPRTISLDEEIACLIGYYTAEGFTRHTSDDTRGKNETGVRQVDFAATEEQAREFIRKTLEKKFSVENPYINDSRITASGTLLTYVWSDIIKGGRLAHTKKVPKVIWDASDNIKGAYLSGYLSGDGSLKAYSTKNSSLKAYTVSEQLKDDLEELIQDINNIPTVKSVEPLVLRDCFPDFYDEDDTSLGREGWSVKINDGQDFIREHGVQLIRKQGQTDRNVDTKTVKEIELTDSSVSNTYNITTSNGRLEINNSQLSQCDGDEDSVMFALDGFLNFSREYLPDAIGRRTMDAPLVTTAVIDPYEIDDEAHMVDVQSEYSREFYIQTWDTPGPKEVNIDIIEDDLDNIRGIRHTTETDSINAGPYSNQYSDSDNGMMDKSDLQLQVCEDIRASDASVVASKVITKHFIPDIMGNLRAYAQQDFRCSSCNTKYRRVPLSGECEECEDGGNLMFTVYRGMINKYVDPASEIAEEYGVDEYTQKRIKLVNEELESIFEMDTEEQTGLDDFM